MPIPIIAVAAAAFYFLRTKKTLSDLQFEPSSIIWSKEKKKFILYMDIINPNSQEIEVKNIFLSVYDNDKVIGNIEKTNSFKVKKSDRTKVSLPIKFNKLGLIESLLAFASDKKNVEYVYEKTKEGDFKLDEDGKKIVKKDSKGKPIKKKSSHVFKVAGTANVFNLPVPISEEVEINV